MEIDLRLYAPVFDTMTDFFDDKLGPQSASQVPLVRKKFAKPPVKVACLPW